MDGFQGQRTVAFQDLVKAGDPSPLDDPSHLLAAEVAMEALGVPGPPLGQEILLHIHGLQESFHPEVFNEVSCRPLADLREFGIPQQGDQVLVLAREELDGRLQKYYLLLVAQSGGIAPLDDAVLPQLRHLLLDMRREQGIMRVMGFEHCHQRIDVARVYHTYVEAKVCDLGIAEALLSEEPREYRDGPWMLLQEPRECSHVHIVKFLEGIELLTVPLRLELCGVKFLDIQEGEECDPGCELPIGPYPLVPRCHRGVYRLSSVLVV